MGLRYQIKGHFRIELIKYKHAIDKEIVYREELNRHVRVCRSGYESTYGSLSY